MKACILLSGGQDSTTALAWALTRFGEIHALSFHYGQRHSRELESAAKIARLAGVTHRVIELPLDEITESDLFTGGGDIDESGELPSSFVPGRNLIMATIAAAYMIPRGIPVLVMGVSQVDFSGYPDCRAETLDALQKTIRLGCGTRDITLITPLINLDKRETVELAWETARGWELLAESWTCYYGGELPCGDCPACRLRAEGFARAGHRDPALR